MQSSYEANSKIEFVKKTRAISLVLSELDIYKISDSIREIPWLESLFLSFNSISDISFLIHLPRLRKLDLRGNQISNIEPISYLDQLEYLDLDNNLISDIAALRGLRHLNKIYLSNNRIKDIFSLSNLTNIVTLDLSNNDIENISALEGMCSLELLNLKNNKILDVAGLATLSNLTNLNLSANHISDITGLQGLSRLEYLTIGSNLISDLSALKNNFRNGLKLPHESLAEERTSLNPLSTPPPEIVARGVKSIVKYFDEIDQQGSDKIYEAKLLIIGEGGAGKTSLVRKIQDYKYDLPQETETTFGIDIIRYPLMKMDDEKMFYLNIWDFGGQEIYHSTHQFFLTSRSLYVLLDDTRKDDKGETDSIFSYWLQIIELLGGNSPLIIIQNEKGDRSKAIDMSGMQSRFGFIKECKQTNLLTNRGLDNVLRSIKYWSSQLPHIGETLPRQWIEIRGHIEHLKENYISIEEYLKICSNYKIPETSRALHLSSYLHDLGVFLHYQENKILANIIILKNHWATDAVYKVMDDEQVKKNQGFFTNSDLNRIWEDGTYRFQHHVLLALMEKFELCYKISKDVHDERWLAPQLLSITSPNYDWDLSSNIQIKYVYFFMPRGLLSRLIVRLNRYLVNLDNAWRNGIILKRNETLAMIKEIYASKIITINIRGKFSKEFATIICEEIDSLNATFQNIRVQKLIPCNCFTCAESTEPHFYKYENLQNRLANGKQTAECEVSYKAVKVKELIDGVFTTVLRKRNEDMKLFISYAHKDEAYKDELIKHLAGLKITMNLTTWNDRDIGAGKNWREGITESIMTADIILLLISADFIASRFIWEHELAIALNRNENGEAIVIPIFLRECDTSGMPFMELQGLPFNAKPVSKFKNRDDAYTEIAKGISKRINRMEKE